MCVAACECAHMLVCTHTGIPHVVASVEIRRQLGVELRPAGLVARALTQSFILLLVSHFLFHKQGWLSAEPLTDYSANKQNSLFR